MIKSHITQHTFIHIYCFTIKLMKEKALRKHSLHEKTATSSFFLLLSSMNDTCESIVMKYHLCSMYLLLNKHKHFRYYI